MEEEKPSAFVDLLSGLFWLALGGAIIIGSWRMDRLEHLQASIYTVPGLVPGVLGTALAIMALVMIARSLRAGALGQAHWPEVRFVDHWRLIVALLLSLVFAIGMVARGMPFWLAAAIYVAVFIFVFQYEDRRRAGSLVRGGAFAALYGLLCGLAVHYVFQDLFLVRLP